MENNKSFMNKYCGLLEIKFLKLPDLEWIEYNEKTTLNPNKLWTVRTANDFGNNIELPHKIGVSSEEAYKCAISWEEKYDHVLINECFNAKISGNIMVYLEGAVIEWVKGNSTDLTRKGRVDETICLLFKEYNKIVKTCLDTKVFEKLKSYAKYIAYKERNYLLDDKAIIVEWSVVDSKNNEIEYSYSENEIVFYDLRIV